MNPIQVIISHHSSNDVLPVISISNSVLKKLKVPLNHPLRLQVANQSSTILCQVNQAKSNIIQMDKELAKGMGIPDQTQLHISYQPHTKELRLGPILAILTSGISRTNPPFGNYNAFCEEMIRCARNRHILAYVVSLAEISKGQNTVNGWLYSQSRWKKMKLPYPQVVYNRISTLKTEKTSHFLDLKKKAAEQKITLFNQTFLSKWDVHSTLVENRELAHYLPHTILFEGPLTLKAMIERFPVLFIKPIHGSLGRGIYRVRKTGKGYQSEYSALNGQIRRHFDKISHLYTYLSKRIRPGRFIIQQGIPILRMYDRAVDFRALIQKNNAGEWAVTSMVARIGSAHRFVSNIATGGELNKVGRTLERCRVPHPQKVRFELIKVAKKACEVIEREKNEHFGELGVDLAVTQSGRIYILEINSKPSKSDDAVASLHSKGRPSVHRLLDYTLHLVNHPKK